MEFLERPDPERPGEYLAEALLGIERLFGVTVTVHDHHALLFDAGGRPFLPGRDHHTHPYCVTGRYANPQWNRNCLAECAFQAESAALCELRPFLHDCWKGVCELVVPVERSRSPVLILYAGPLQGKGGPPPGFEEEFAALPVPDPAVIADLARLLTLAGQGILRILETGRAEERRAPVSRKQLICRFLDEHAHEPVTLADLAAAMNVSPSRAGHLVTAAFAASFQELVLAERMTRARNLLLSTDYPQKEIARSCGFRTVYYFNRMFRRFYGISPGRFRQKEGRDCGQSRPDGTEMAVTSRSRPAAAGIH